MRTSIATVSLSGTLEQKLRAAADAGFDGVEIFENDLISSPLAPREVRRLCDSLGLAVELYQPFRDLDSADDADFEAGLRRLEAKLGLAAELGAPGILVCSNVSSTAARDDRELGRQLRAAAELASAHGLTIAYEALAWGTHVSTYEHAWKVVAEVDHPALTICLDSFHIFSAGSTLEAIAAIPGEKIGFIQLADAPAMNLDPLSWSRHHRLFPGQGSFDLPGFMAAVMSAGFRGAWSIEVFNDVFRQTDPMRTAVDALRSLVWLGGEVGRRVTSGAEALPHLGAAPRLSALDFLELTPDPDGHLEHALGALGFKNAGEHRSKPGVRLWSLGDAHLVINPRPLSRAAVPGERITAMGFRVDEAEHAGQRAQLLHAELLARPNEPGDQRLVAVRAPDGLEIYFSDEAASSAWPAEFRARADPDSAHGARIDHFAVSVPWQYFDEAVLFYRSVVGLRSEAEVDVADLHGLVKSQALEAARAGIRLVLNVLPPGMAQVDPRDVAHIAIEYDDVADAVTRARQAGVGTVAAPENYYDDLAARFELPPDRITELRAHDLFYDRDASGAEYLQAYTGDVGGLFFELIQRDPHYAGYGAVNSPIRRAAQQNATGAGASLR